MELGKIHKGYFSNSARTLEIAIDDRAEKVSCSSRTCFVAFSIVFETDKLLKEGKILRLSCASSMYSIRDTGVLQRKISYILVKNLKVQQKLAPILKI